MRTGVVNLPLHYGKAPSWLFKRMAALVREIVMLMVMELGRKAVLEKLSDPAWFQALGCIVGFDWHSSGLCGLTTTVCGALKEGVKGVEKELGLFVAGGKGKTSRQTPHEIERVGSLLTTNPELVSELVYGVPPSYRDPARFSFAHGGKDGHPYPVDRITYDKSIEILRQAVSRAKIGEKDKLAAIKRLLRFIPE